LPVLVVAFSKPATLGVGILERFKYARGRRVIDALDGEGMTKVENAKKMPATRPEPRAAARVAIQRMRSIDFVFP
jgi:hypothetical protein